MPIQAIEHSLLSVEPLLGPQKPGQSNVVRLLLRPVKSFHVGDLPEALLFRNSFTTYGTALKPAAIPQVASALWPLALLESESNQLRIDPFR